MKNYDYQRQLKAIWEKAVRIYDDGNRKPDTFFDDTESAFLDSVGLTSQEVYDFAEDYNDSGEPDFTSFAMIQDVRRFYFLNRQNGLQNGKQVDPSSLPARDLEAEGIPWLPRIIAKAKAKLRGEMHPDFMYSCGGDRQFFKEHDIHAAEFLRVVADNEDNDRAVIDWVLSRKNAS